MHGLGGQKHRHPSVARAGGVVRQAQSIVDASPRGLRAGSHLGPGSKHARANCSFSGLQETPGAVILPVVYAGISNAQRAGCALASSQGSDTVSASVAHCSLTSRAQRNMMRSAACSRPARPLSLRAQPAKRGRVVLARAIETPSSATGSDLLHQLKEHTVVLSDDSMAALTTPQEAESSAALANFGLLSHVLANTSAFSEFEVRAATLLNACALS